MDLSNQEEKEVSSAIGGSTNGYIQPDGVDHKCHTCKYFGVVTLKKLCLTCEGGSNYSPAITARPDLIKEEK